MDALLASLGRLPSPTPHLQHLHIRLRRTAHAYQNIHQTAQSRDEHKARLLSRLHELEEQLEELGDSAKAAEAGGDGQAGLVSPELGDGGRPGKDGDGRWEAYAECTSVARQLRLMLQTMPPTPTKPAQPCSPAHSRSPSAPDLARKPPPAQPDPALAAFLASASAAPPPLPSRASSSGALQSRAHELSSAFTLHLLANEPAAVLRPGQSLASLFRRQLAVAPPNAPKPPSEAHSHEARQDGLEGQARSTVHVAFLDGLGGRLAQPAVDAGTALAAWHDLRRIVWEVAGPLVPSLMGGGKTKSALQARFQVATVSQFSLFEATSLVWTLAATLAQLCAPSRDGQVRAVLAALSQDGDPAGPASNLSVAAFVSAVGQLLALAGDMVKDVAAFRSNLASVVTTDDELEDLATREAVERERAVVLTQYAGDVAGRGVGAQRGAIDASVGAWVGRKTGADVSGWESAETGWKNDKVAEALVETVFSEQAVALPDQLSSPLPPPEPSAGPSPPGSNFLPPTLVVPSPRLFSLQNKLQAAVILACLLSLAGTPTPLTPGSQGGSAWVPRVWTLLTAASAQPPPPPASATATATADDTSTRLTNLSDEILATTYGPGVQVTPVLEAERARIRQGVDRILSYSDPVFNLLRNRLKAGLKAALLASVHPNTPFSGSVTSAVPEMRTGRTVIRGASEKAEVRAGVRAKERASVKVEPIRGFAGTQLLWGKVEECALELVQIEEWQRSVWGS